MMEIYRIAFIGHRRIESFDKIEEKLENIIFTMLSMNDYIDFYFGNNGEFDNIAQAAVRRIRRQFGSHNSTVNLVLPYSSANISLFEEQFDSVFIPDAVYSMHPKKAITERNKWLADNCDLLICYVEREEGGAWNTLKYAKKKSEAKILNLAETDEW